MDTPATALPEHAECVIDAASQTLGATCGVAVEQIDDAEAADSGGDGVIGIISLVGDVEWSLFFGMPSETAVAAAAKFAGFDIPFESEDMGDAFGELTNMLAGQAKLNLDQKGVEADISLPSVLRAQNIKVLVQQQASVVRTSFKCELGTFWIGLAAKAK